VVGPTVSTNQTCAAIAGREEEGVGHEEAGWVFWCCADSGDSKLLVSESRGIEYSGEDIWMLEVVVVKPPL